MVPIEERTLRPLRTALDRNGVSYCQRNRGNLDGAKAADPE
ncbi:hypothetical protein AB7M49_006961 [Bradyrhizobium elkanii]